MGLMLKGRKRGMTQLFDEKGNFVPCTVIEVESNQVVQIKTKEKEGYSAIQVGFEKVSTDKQKTLEKRMTKPRLAHFKKAGVDPHRSLFESKVDNEGEYQIGQELNLDIFKDTEFLDVIAISKGKGFQGAMKLHNFRGGRASHGNSKSHRSLGSTGMCSSPGRCFPGGKRASRMGGKRVTVQSLRVIQVEGNVLVVKGAVPGPRNGVVTLRAAKKKSLKK